MAEHSPTPGFLIWRLAMKLRVAVDRALAPLDLTHAQYSLLASLYGVQRSGRRPSQRELADHTGLEPLYVSKLARTLEAAGLVERIQHPDDTRAVQLSLSARGEQVVLRAIATVRALHGELMAPLGGLRSERGQAFMADLVALLDTPLTVDGPVAP
jgi:MarR family transcriptional regulator, organic hydroperoxide resistance regulator